MVIDEDSKLTGTITDGMANLGEVESAIEVIKGPGNGKITLLHYTSNYPTYYE